MLFAGVLSVATGVVGCEWPISVRSFCMDVTFCNFLNNPPNSASMADAMISLVILYFTCTGPFYGGIAVIGVLDFLLREKIHLLCFVPLIQRCRMHLNIYGESLRFFYTILLCMDVTRCNLIIVRYIFMSLLLVLYVTPPGILVSLTFLGPWIYHNTGIFQNLLELFLIIFIKFFS